MPEYFSGETIGMWERVMDCGWNVRHGSSRSSSRDTAFLAAAGIALLLAGASNVLAAGSGSSAAHDMADRFARSGGDAGSALQPAAPVKAPAGKSTSAQAQKPAAKADDLKSYEDELLARARAEAEARARDDLAAGEAKARAELEQRLARERAGETRRLSERLRTIREERRARTAREAEDARAKAMAEELAKTEAEARLAAGKREQERIAAEKADAEAKARAKAEAELREKGAAEHARAVLRERQRHLAERIEGYKAARTAEIAAAAAAERAALPAGPTTTVAHAPTVVESAPAVTEVGSLPVVAAKQAASHTDLRDVTVLLVMDAGSRGIRRWNKNADPMLCVGGSCYVSRGADVPAEQMSHGKAFGPGVALGKRAGACSNHLGCVFRHVDLGSTREWLQPVDLRILRHDRRESKLVTADPTCAITAGRLSCDRAIDGGTWRAWIVPEHIARRAGAAALEAALERELAPHHDMASHSNR